MLLQRPFLLIMEMLLIEDIYAGNGPYHPKPCDNSDVLEIAGVTSSTNKERIRMVLMLRNHSKVKHSK